MRQAQMDPTAFCTAVKYTSETKGARAHTSIPHLRRISKGVSRGGQPAFMRNRTRHFPYQGAPARKPAQAAEFIFQDFNLLDTLTAFENIALALTIQEGKKAKNIRDRVLEVAKKLDIEEVLSKFPYEMSGGQKQRVAAARAIITNPSLILADEPTGALDSKASRLLLDSFEKLNEEMKATILMVTHDAFTASYAHRILFIKDGRVFNELIRGNDSRKEFFNRIIEVVTLLGGDTNNVF